MTIQLTMQGGPTTTLESEYITFGSDRSCTVSFPDISAVMPKHAVIHLVAGRWLIEVRQGKSIIVGGTEHRQTHWLNPGDCIQLTENSPSMRFDFAYEDPQMASTERTVLVQSSVPQTQEIPTVQTRELPAVGESPTVMEQPALKAQEVQGLSAEQHLPLLDDEPLRLASDTHSLPFSESHTKKTPSKTPPVVDALQTEVQAVPKVKSPSSKEIPTLKKTTSTTIPTVKPSGSEVRPIINRQSSSSNPPTKAPSSTTINTVKPGAEDELRSAKSNSKSPSPSSMNLSQAGVTKQRSKPTGSTNKSEESEAEPKVPVLKRISYWEAPVQEQEDDDSVLLSSGGYNHRKRKPGHDADIEYIQSVVIKCIGVGLVLFVLYYGIRELVTAINAPSVSSVTPSLIAPQEHWIC